MLKFDTVIIGGGLAGLSCGIHLLDSKPGSDVVVIDRLQDDAYDRYHRTCGEALSKATEKEMKPIRLVGQRHTIDMIEEVWPGNLIIKAKIRGFIIDRPIFLHSLQDDFIGRGGHLINGSIARIVTEGDYYLLHTGEEVIRCRWLVGADGAFSRVRKSLFLETPKELLAVKQFVVQRFSEDDQTIRFVYDEKYGGGYLWEFPCGSYLNTGYPKGCGHLIDDIVEENGRYIPLGSLENVVQGHACLVGDAAAMVNPLSFGGIRIALLSGKMAAKALAKGDLSNYQKWWIKSSFSDPVFYDCYVTSKGWDNEDMWQFIHPFRRGYGVIPFVLAYLSRPNQRKMITSYYRSFKLGW